MILVKQIGKGLNIGFVLLNILFVWSCHSSKKETLFTLMEKTGVNFINTVEDTPEENCFQFRNYYNGGGVALGDLNNDGLPDIVFTSNLGNNTIYFNEGNFKFKDITAQSGFHQNGQWSTGVSLADINHDGWLDIYICSSGHMAFNKRMNQLYINNQDGTFTEAAEQYGLNISGYCTQAAFFDYDLDGDLDCFLINNTPIPFGTLNYGSLRDSSEAAWNLPEYLKGGGNHLYRNDHDYFVEVSGEAGLHASLISFGLGLSVADFNADGYPDVYVGNDFFERDYLYINQKNGTFNDELENYFQHISMSSMGTDVADINNDGYPDIYTTDMFPYDDYRLKTTGTVDNFDLYRSKIKAGFYHQYVRNCLQVNNRNGKFYDVANYAGVAETDWSWGTLLFDIDNDGRNDIFVCNGINRDLSDLDFLDYLSNSFYQGGVKSVNNFTDSLLKTIPRNPLPNRVYHNTGNLKFEETSKAWGLDQPGFSNSVAYADLDNDGDLDLVINNENQPASVYRNNASSNRQQHFISLRLKGDSLNPFAVGASVKMFAAEQIFFRELQPVRGFQSSVDYVLHVGVGSIQNIDSMIISWPDLKQSKVFNIRVDSAYEFNIADSVNTTNTPASINSGFFEFAGNNFETHKEDDYTDFYQERNIPEMLSREGPKSAIGDVNGDGWEDIYIGGAANQAGQLYLQQPGGKFIQKEEPVFKEFASFEDAAVLFFDADADGDMDLFIGPGGNNQLTANRETQLRLYKNDGKGNFTIFSSAFPNNSHDIGAVAVNDFDGDGDLDLFVGGRCIPGNYGVNPRSYLFVNNGNGAFTDIAFNNEAISQMGMITGAAWADIDGDNKSELVVVGEWAYPHIFKYINGGFTELRTNLADMFGLWKSLAIADINNDGKQDLILGNIGENFYLLPTASTPVKLWINDYDGNGLMDKVMTRTIDGKDMTVFLKREMQDQLPILKKQALLHRDFAVKPLQELFTSAQVQSSSVKQINFVSSVIAYNQGNGNFDIQSLPPEVQLSSVNAIAVEDVNHDNQPDIITAGNTLHFQPLLGRLDANYGSVIINKGKAGFELLDTKTLGIQITGSVKDIKVISVAATKRFLFLINDAEPRMYRLKN